MTHLDVCGAHRLTLISGTASNTLLSSSSALTPGDLPAKDVLLLLSAPQLLALLRLRTTR